MLLEVLGQTKSPTTELTMPSISGLLSLPLVCASNCGSGSRTADDRREALAEVLAGGHEVLEDVLLLAVGVERARQRRAEAGEVRAAVDGIDVVGVAVDVLGVLAAVLEGHLDLDARRFVLVVDVDDVVMDGLGGAVQEADELDQAVAVLERLAVAACACP